MRKETRFLSLRGLRKPELIDEILRLRNQVRLLRKMNRDAFFVEKLQRRDTDDKRK